MRGPSGPGLSLRQCYCANACVAYVFALYHCRNSRLQSSAWPGPAPPNTRDCIQCILATCSPPLFHVYFPLSFIQAKIRVGIPNLQLLGSKHCLSRLLQSVLDRDDPGDDLGGGTFSRGSSLPGITQPIIASNSRSPSLSQKFAQQSANSLKLFNSEHPEGGGGETG